MAAEPTTYSVKELTFYIKHVLEQDRLLQGVKVSGEISNLTYHRSGHVYFAIKDAETQLTCVMFKGYAQYAPKMQEGDQVILSGNITVYAPRGNYQMLVKHVRKEGQGDLYQRFLALKDELRKEGLFDPAHKKAIPVFPQHVAVLTSPTGAAIRDMLQTLHRRYPVVKVTVIPTVVQGTGGAASIVKSLQQADQTAADVILLGRGGGSIEDLWNFNEAVVARAIYECSIPVICGVGHETDVTIADFVADLRASTPTAAAERAVPDLSSLLYTLDEYEQQLRQGLQYFIDVKRQVLDDYGYRLEQAVAQGFRTRRHQLELMEAQLKAMDHQNTLQRGYTLTLKEGQILKQKEGLAAGDKIDTVFTDGKITSTID